MTEVIFGYFLSVSPEECENNVKTAMEYLNKVRKQLAAQGIDVCCTVQEGPVVETIFYEEEPIPRTAFIRERDDR